MSALSSLANVSQTRAVLEKHGLTTKYSLGQNFLVNDAIVQKIVALADVQPSDVVLEVGPGIGTLTMALLQRAGSVIAVERDPDLPAVLAETLAAWVDAFTLISKDALDLCHADLQKAGPSAAGEPPQKSEPSFVSEPSQKAESSAADKPSEHALPNKLVANLPYAVAATVVLDYFERFSSLESATVMVQKEVADRMAAKPGSKNYGAYTVKLRLYAQPAGRFSVGPGNFFPPPRVESAVLRLNRSAVCDEAGVPLDDASIRAACTMADAAFATRRKTIANSCKTYFAGRGSVGARAAEALPHMFEQAGIDPKRRGETLDLAEFVRLGQAFQTLVEPHDQPNA